MQEASNEAFSGALDGFSEYDAVPRVEIHRSGRLTGYAQDLGFMWRWEIHRDGQTIQEGCSLSENSAREAVGHAAAFLGRLRDTPDDE
nr:soluble methane monooxygenase-binding protein MmoD [uncultured Rhodopila sp.]